MTFERKPTLRDEQLSMIDSGLFMGHNGAEIQRGRHGAVRIRSPYDQIAKTGRSGSANVATIVAPDRGGKLRARIYDLASKEQPEPAEIRITPHENGNHVEVFLDNKHFVRPAGENDFAVSGHSGQATPDELVRINACADALMALTDPEAHRAEVAPIDPSMAPNFGRIALQ